jgi:hypothetical protein
MGSFTEFEPWTPKPQHITLGNLSYRTELKTLAPSSILFALCMSYDTRSALIALNLMSVPGTLASFQVDTFVLTLSRIDLHRSSAYHTLNSNERSKLLQQLILP